MDADDCRQALRVKPFIKKSVQTLGRVWYINPMTRHELVKAIEVHLGLRLATVNAQGDTEELVALSPTDKQLFTVTIGQNQDGTWTWGGCGR
ncbi:hypothetical protein C4565_08290, partial [Candidatus Parcubacteria bacterium]